MVGFVGVPHGVELPIEQMFFRTVGVRGGGAPVRVYLPELLEDVLAERINPGRVLDYETDLEGIADAYAAMDERRAIKSMSFRSDAVRAASAAWSRGTSVPDVDGDPYGLNRPRGGSQGGPHAI